MKSLFYLSMTKWKGTIRNQFRSISSAILTIFMVLLYGGLFVAVFLIPSDAMSEVMNMQFNTALLMGLGVLALLCVTVLMNKRKALVYDTDAFYLFAGPYTRKQINGFILVQTWFQSAIYGLICSYVTAMMSFGNGFTVSMMLFSFVIYWLIMAFFLTLTDYIYLWSLVKKKHEIWNYVVVLLVVFSAAAVFFLSVQRTGYDLKNGYMDFALSREFYMVPFFGWGKWAINAFSQGNYVSMLWGIPLLVGCNLVLGILFLHFQKDIVEQAVEDAQSVSDYMRKVRANKGNSIMDTKKVKGIKGEFPEGAKAIFYKNMLMMRKTGNFLRKQDIFVIVLYFVISYVCMPGHRFYMFCYMMMIWMFGLMNDAELLGDLKNYQIYLIPEKPLKKLFYAVIPAYLKIGIILGTAIIFSGVLNRMPVLDIVQYALMLLGYAMIFLAGTVLSVRLLKSRTNVMMENLLRMLIILVCAIPSSVLGVLCYFIFRDLNMIVMVTSIFTLVLNFGVSILIMVACQGMMNGKQM
nr:putative ABC exporter domain-containing protein [uncultured Blautia sp.]